MESQSSRLENFPVSWFAVTMGLFGFTIAWSRAEHILHLDIHLSRLFLWVTVGVSLLITVIYILKMIRYPHEVMGEIQHPIKISFMPTFSIGLLLFSIAFLKINSGLSLWTWAIGTALHFYITLYVASSWVHHTKYEINHLNPAWFIPIVGNILVPVAGVHHAAPEISWFFFSIGLFFWPILTGVIFYRLIFHGSLPQRFMPTLFIFIAPPSVALISWYKLTGTVGVFGKIQYSIALFFFILLVFQLKYFIRLRFYLSWWAYSFPIAALTIATLIMGEDSGPGVYSGIAFGLLGCITFVIVMLIVYTAFNVARRTICIEEEHL